MITLEKGILISLEGIDGSGKTTAAITLVKLLQDEGYNVIHTREPGGTYIAEKIRNLLLTVHQGETLVPMAELLLFAAARAQHIEEKIKPAMQAGAIVITDRFSDSTYAYQGKGRRYTDDVLLLEQLVHKGFEPNYTLFLDITLDESLKRLKTRPDKSDRLDEEGLEFKRRIFEGYHERALLKQYRTTRINAMCTPVEVNCQISKWVNKTLIPNLK